MLDGSVLEMINTLGINVVTLLACFWFIKYQTDQHTRRESEWAAKDTAADLRLTESHRELANLQANSNAQLLNVLEKVNTTLTAMTVAISELKQTIEVAETVNTRTRT